MALRRLSGECRDIESCPGVWEDDAYPEDLIIVGNEPGTSAVPIGPGEVAVRVNRQFVRDALGT